MNTELHPAMPLGGAEDPVRSSLAYMALELVRLAGKLGYVITVEQMPLQPLAMGHHSTRVSVRPARERA